MKFIPLNCNLDASRQIHRHSVFTVSQIPEWSWSCKHFSILNNYSLSDAFCLTAVHLSSLLAADFTEATLKMYLFLSQTRLHSENLPPAGACFLQELLVWARRGRFTRYAFSVTDARTFEMKVWIFSFFCVSETLKLYITQVVVEPAEGERNPEASLSRQVFVNSGI